MSYLTWMRLSIIVQSIQLKKSHRIVNKTSNYFMNFRIPSLKSRITRSKELRIWRRWKIGWRSQSPFIGEVFRLIFSVNKIWGYLKLWVVKSDRWIWRSWRVFGDVVEVACGWWIWGGWHVSWACVNYWRQ